MKYLNENIVIVSKSDKGTLVYENTTGKSYRLGDDELQILAYLCAGKDEEYICNDFRGYSKTNVKRLIDLYQKIFFDVSNIDFTSKKKYCFPKGFIGLINKKFFKVYACITLFASIPIFLISILHTIIIGHFFSIIEIKTSIVNIFLNIIVLLVSLVFCFFFHETAHAFVASSFGCEVTDIGIVRSEHRFEGFSNIIGFERLDTPKKILVMLAGIFANMRITGYGLLIGNTLLDNFSWYCYLLAFISFISIIVNLLPIKKFDGRIIYDIIKKQRKNM